MDIEEKAQATATAEEHDHHEHPFHEAAILATAAAVEPENHGPMAFTEAMARLVHGG